MYIYKTKNKKFILDNEATTKEVDTGEAKIIKEQRQQALINAKEQLELINKGIIETDIAPEGLISETVVTDIPVTTEIIDKDTIIDKELTDVKTDKSKDI